MLNIMLDELQLILKVLHTTRIRYLLIADDEVSLLNDSQGRSDISIWIQPELVNISEFLKVISTMDKQLSIQVRQLFFSLPKLPTPEKNAAEIISSVEYGLSDFDEHYKIATDIYPKGIPVKFIRTDWLTSRVAAAFTEARILRLPPST